MAKTDPGEHSDRLLDLSATLWERLSPNQRAEWLAESPEAAKAARDEKRRPVH